MGSKLFTVIWVFTSALRSQLLNVIFVQPIELFEIKFDIKMDLFIFETIWETTGNMLMAD